MGRSTRRAVLQGTAAAAGLAAVQASGLAGSAQAGTGGGHPKAKALLVHGAWVDGSSWRRVIAILQRDGDNVVAVRLPLTSWGEEVAWTRQVLAERLQGPTVLAGHCDGGAVIAGAATGVEEVVGLVFASAFAPEEGRAWVGSGAGFRRRLAWPPPSLTRWAFVVRSGGGPDRRRSTRWRRRDSASSPPPCAATTCPRSRTASRPTTAARWPPTSAVWSKNAVPTPRCWSVTTGDDQLLPGLGADLAKRAEAVLRPISAPTLVIWGQRDRYLGQELAEPEHDDVPNLDRVERLPDASHWVHHDQAERVNQLLIDFFTLPCQPSTAEGRPARTSRASLGATPKLDGS